MIVALNYANEPYKKHQRLNTKTAYLFGKVDTVYAFSPGDIDKEFYEKNKNILSVKRGNGLWLWKPYLINKVINALQNGDIVCYADAGTAYLRNVNGMITKLKDSDQDIMLFEIPLIECQWTKKAVFEVLDAYTEAIRFSNQTLGIIIIIVSENSRKFIKKWLDLCQNEILMLPKEKDASEDELYIAHREDQSILSVLAKKEGIIPFNDPSDYGKLPLQYLSSNRLFRLNKDRKYRLDKTYFLLYRKANPLLYYLKFCMKSILFNMNLLMYQAK
ncbi:hypothetical protein FACS189413_03160 [Bacteroidia bacterium]|nr:hypothetical protein FACS189413_03160 [Bacteroidia bacterium]